MATIIFKTYLVKILTRMVLDNPTPLTLTSSINLLINLMVMRKSQLQVCIFSVTSPKIE